MPVSEGPNLSGTLVEWPGGHVARPHLLLCERLAYQRLIPSSQWEEYTYKCDVAFRGEDHYGVPSPYEYAVVIRRSGPRCLILASARNIAQHLISTDLARVISPRLVTVSIAVDNLVRKLCQKPTVYVLSFVHARLPAFGASLRSVSLYGDDLAEASMFRDHVGLMNFFTCGLRRAVGGPELLRLGADGTVSFYLTDPHRVLEVEGVLSFLRQEGYLSGDVLKD